jgi:hypothetical protein
LPRRRILPHGRTWPGAWVIALAALSVLASGCRRTEVRLPSLAPGWSEIVPGGETACARGTEFAYFVRPGTVNRVIIEFVGGGACWSDVTCTDPDKYFTDSVEPMRETVRKNELNKGISDHENPQNPFKDWYHVVIPYCTGDIHWGDNVVTYGQGDDRVTIHHKGAANTRAVLDWVYKNFSAPEQVLVTGCSAGSYGSAMWAPHVMNHYPTSRVTQFGDSGAGIITNEFFQKSFPSWRAEGAFPAFISELDPARVNVRGLDFPDVYAAVGSHFPAQRVSQYNTAFDDNQSFYYKAMGGGDVEEWSSRMFASIASVKSRTPNFASFIASGEQHCIIPYNNFYTVNVNGRLLTDWLRDLVNRVPVESVTCKGCEAPTPGIP